MPKSKRIRTCQGSQCPICFHFFYDVLRHLNHRQSRCSTWFGTTSQSYSPTLHDLEFEDALLPEPPSPQPSDHQRSPSPIPPASSHVSFPGAGKTYGEASTFLDRFNNDQYGPFHATNMYYPFLNEAEWELASFLLSSDLSMRKIDELLKLKLVSSIVTTNLNRVFIFLGSECRDHLQHGKDPSRTDRNAAKGSRLEV